MAFKYPKISNCLTYKKYDESSVEVTDLLAESVYLMDTEEARYIRKLDGKTHPYRIKTTLTRREIDVLIDNLDECDLLKRSNKRIVEGRTVLRTIWEPKWTDFMRLIAFVCNNLLIISWLPVLIIGMWMFDGSITGADFGMVWSGSVLGIVSGMILHEFGHAFAGVSYGAKVFEMGVLRMYYIMPGAYVIMDDQPVKSGLRRAQINAAGVEVNFLLTGIFLILGAVYKEFDDMFLIAAIHNAVLAITNLTFINGFDGMNILSNLIGIDNLAEKAKHIVLNRKKKKEMKEKGLIGSAAVAVCLAVWIFQIALPAFLILNVLEVVLCFI